MKINRTQDVHNVPRWVTAGTHLEAIEKNAEMLQAGIDRINATASTQVDENCLFEECDHIEKCASNGGTYYYNNTWQEQHIAHLREYASVCRLPGERFVGVDPTPVVEKTASTEQMVKTASTEVSPLEASLKDALGDPFKIEERSNMDHMKQANWEKVTPQSTMTEKPDMNLAMVGGILPLRGGEDYRIANQPGLARNQNSISDPEALDRLWNSEEEDTGTRLAREAREREEAKKSKHAQWQAEKIAEMQADGFEAQGVVFPTEVGNVGSGISSSFMGAYSEADLQNLPERTAGESLASANEARKASIQRGAKSEERNWEEVKQAPSRMVSDHFTEELKKRLG